MSQGVLHVPSNPVRFITAASLFDGHDAAINIMRRILQAQGVEVIHLGHDRSVSEIVTAALQEDVQGIAISSYQGGHVEYFTYLVECLRQEGIGHIRVYGGGGGVIIPSEIETLAKIGVRIFSPQDGQKYGLVGMINQLVADCDTDLTQLSSSQSSKESTVGIIDSLRSGSTASLARTITFLQKDGSSELGQALRLAAKDGPSAVLGITGTGGSGKSSLTDELLRRFRTDSQDNLPIAVLAIDPTRKRGGGALLGDRIRMNSIDERKVYFRSLATRITGHEMPHGIDDMIAACKVAGYSLIIVETPGIGQGSTAITAHVDASLYVMTPEYGASSQLEKIDMLDFADVVAINKFERRGAEDALRDVQRQLIRNRGTFGIDRDHMPVFGTSAARFNDDGVSILFQHLKSLLTTKGMKEFTGVIPKMEGNTSTDLIGILPRGRESYLRDISSTVRNYHESTIKLVEAVRNRDHLKASLELLERRESGTASKEILEILSEKPLDEEAENQLTSWTKTRVEYLNEDESTNALEERSTPLYSHETLSGTKIPRVALPPSDENGALLRFLREENLPGNFPFTAGVFPFKRLEESPARMFAGEGDPQRTNRRFHLLSAGQDSTRLSTAFDSVTLYGMDPASRPDIYGKVGTSGVSIATLDDMQDLFTGFDLCAPNTSVSMTINGPAPTILAMFLNTVIEQQVDRFSKEFGRAPNTQEHQVLTTESLIKVRGTVQADILKEDQGQNTCIFSTEFSLRCMADVQEWFIENSVKNFYSASISGYHIAEAGANPISQLAFTLANGFTYVEYYVARGMSVNDFAPNLSFFFSNGMDAEYTVLGRVARRIWAIGMRNLYMADERSQKLKYHIQTSGRSLHAQEMDFNDIRTTLQALCALYDNANSLHTNAFDEAVTTPSEQSVRRAMAIQMIINQEWGLSLNENPLQGSYIVTQLTDLVEEAVLLEFERLSDRGGVLGAMETGYQRGRIQDESMLYEHRKHDGSLPIIGVNTFLDDGGQSELEVSELARGTVIEKESQIRRLQAFHTRHQDQSIIDLAALRQASLTGGNVFAALMVAVKSSSLGQITDVFFEVGGKYRRNI